MRAFVFGGGEIYAEYIEERPESGDMVICADSGYKNACAMGVAVDVLVGDFDSMTEIPDGNFELVRVPAEKDSTDTQLAVAVALERGADEIVIIGEGVTSLSLAQAIAVETGRSAKVLCTTECENL